MADITREAPAQFSVQTLIVRSISIMLDSMGTPRISAPENTVIVQAGERTVPVSDWSNDYT